MYHRSSSRQQAIKAGFRSGLEEKIAQQLTSLGVAAEYETTTIRYSIPESMHRYTPDFVLPNGIIIETKGRFTAEDRQKHLLIREQHPELDIRFVFSRSTEPITKGSKTTLANWCAKNGFKFAAKTIPLSWLEEE